MAAHYRIHDPSTKDKRMTPGDVAIAGSFSCPAFPFIASFSSLQCFHFSVSLYLQFVFRIRLVYNLLDIYGLVVNVRNILLRN